MCGQLPPNQRLSMTATDAPRASLVGRGLAGRTCTDDDEVEGFHAVMAVGPAWPDGAPR